MAIVLVLGAIVKDARVVQPSDQRLILEAKREVKMEQRNEQKRAENLRINNITARETSGQRGSHN